MCAELTVLELIARFTEGEALGALEVAGLRGEEQVVLYTPGCW